MTIRKDALLPTDETPAATTLDVDDDLAPVAQEVPRQDTAERFAPEQEIGRGGMGVVILARDTALRRMVALKRLRADLPSTAARRQRFVAEAQLTAQLDHPTIPPVHDIGLTPEGELYYVMKLARGRTLAEILRTMRKAGGDPDWPLRRLIRALLQACDGVAYAHSRGVVHRDLKPGNLIFGDYGEVYVLDWGVAALLGEAVDAALLPPATVVGTHGYASPEQLAAGAHVDERTDVWSLGTILAEILQWIPAPPQELVAAAARATRADPALRHPTVRAFAAAVEAWQDAQNQREADRIGWGRRNLELSALAMDARAVRIHDALSHLVELTRILFEGRESGDPDAWLAAAGFAIDADGYFQPADLPHAIRAGQAPPDALSWCWPPSRAEDPVARAHMYALRGIGPALLALTQRVRDLTFVYYADARNVALVFPADDMRGAVPSEFDFLSYPAFVVATPDRNPGRGLRATPPHVDYGNKGLITAMAVPVYVGEAFVGVWAADVPLSVLHADVHAEGPDELAIIVDRTGLLVSHSGEAAPTGAEKGAIWTRRLADEPGPLGKLDVDALFAAGHGELRLADEGAELLVQFRVAPYLGWALCSVWRSP
jgi:tRNA A-37 threonylcarbamoyl transferase component Bud32